MLDSQEEKLSLIPTVVGADTAEELSQVKIAPKSIDQLPTLLVGLPKTWLPTVSAKELSFKLPIVSVLLFL